MARCPHRRRPGRPGASSGRDRGARRTIIPARGEPGVALSTPSARSTRPFGARRRPRRAATRGWLVAPLPSSLPARRRAEDRPGRWRWADGAMATGRGDGSRRWADTRGGRRSWCAAQHDSPDGTRGTDPRSPLRHRRGGTRIPPEGHAPSRLAPSPRHPTAPLRVAGSHAPLRAPGAARGPSYARPRTPRPIPPLGGPWGGRRSAGPSPPRGRRPAGGTHGGGVPGRPRQATATTVWRNGVGARRAAPPEALTTFW